MNFVRTTLLPVARCADHLSRTTAMVLVLCAASPAYAQAAAETPALDQLEAATAPAENDAIVVTGSRVARAGFSAPTPTTVLGAEELQKTGAPNVADVLNQLPAFQGTSTPSSTSRASQGAGGNYLDLRGLGTTRTLVLVDRRRHVPTNSSGSVDINVVPSSLIERVEVVTGGASAAWGSDAVAGVVNLIFKRDVEGLSGDFQVGVSERDDGTEFKGSLTYGTAFAAGRGHFMIAGEYSTTEGTYIDGRDWAMAGYQPVANPNYRPGNGEYQRLILPNVHATNVTPGGVIVGGPLQGWQFGTGGVPEPFIYGQYAGASYMSGGSGVMPGRYSLISTPLDRYNVFARATFEVSPSIEAFAEASYAKSVTDYPLNTSYVLGNLRVQRDNAFLHPEMQRLMDQAGVTQFNMGRLNWDLGFTQDYVGNTTYRGVAGLKGELAGGWEWNAYVESGRNEYRQRLHNNLRTARFTEASDAVRHPVTGEIVCRSTLSNPTNGCVPLNVFGHGSPSDAAHAYVMGTQSMYHNITQQAAAADISGEPFSLWAGPVSVATGVEYRRDSIKGDVDALSLANAFQFGNPKPIEGSYNVKEVFGEILLPLVKEVPLIKSLDIDLAARLTDYSTSGTVKTWKAGLSWEVFDDLRIRATRSRDIRAPNLNELFSSYVLTRSNIVDPTNGRQTQVKTPSTGNPDLQPELADTLTAGIVYQPGWLRGFRASVDYYDIKLEDAISTISAQEIVNRCQAGNTALCGFIERDASGVIDTVTRAFINLNQRRVSGVDIELAYATPLSRLSESLSGDLNLRFLATYADKLETYDGVTRLDRVGDVGADAGGIPKWRWNAKASYQNGPLGLHVEGRYIGGGAYDASQGEFYISPNKVNSQFLLNTSVQYDLLDDGDRSLQLFAAVNNLLDRDPPIAPSSFIFVQATNRELYEQIGRAYRLGLRFKY